MALMLPKVEPEERLYLILNGAKRKSQDLGYFIWTLQPDTEGMALYQGTDYEPMLGITPWIIELQADSALTEWYLEEGLAQNHGILLSSDAPFPVLAEHWRWLINARHPLGHRLVFSPWNPYPLRYLLDASSPQELARLFGPTQAIYLPDPNDEQNWLCYRSGEQAKIDHKLPYPLSDHQWASLELAQRDKFAGQIAMHIEEFFPELCLAEPSLEVAKRWIARAMKLGFEAEIDLYFFCNINGYLGEEGYLQPEHREIGALVTEPNQQTPSQRIKRAAQLAEQQAALV